MAAVTREEIATEVTLQDAAFAEALAELEALDPATQVAVPESFFDDTSTAGRVAEALSVDWSRRA